MRQTVEETVKGSMPSKYSAQYYIAPEAQAHLMSILRNMYSEPVKAVVREFLANALDAHRDKERGMEEPMPIEIETPGSFNNHNLVVRDYGLGLDAEEFQKYMLGYGVTGESKWTDQTQIGGFGIGCKSFFAIADSAVFTTYKDGVKRTWLCQPDQSEAGRPKCIEEASSERPSGVLVKIPVPPSYRNKVSEAVDYYLECLNYPVKVDGRLHRNRLQEYVEKVSKAEVCFDIPIENDSVKRIIWTVGEDRLYGRSRDVDIVINGIRYPLGGEYAADIEKTVCDHSLSRRGHLIVEVEDLYLKLSPTREGFIQNATTKKGVQHIFELLHDRIHKEIQKELECKASPRDAVLTYISYILSGVAPSPFSDNHETALFGGSVSYSGGTAQIAEQLAVTAEEIRTYASRLHLAGYGKSYARLNTKITIQTVGWENGDPGPLFSVTGSKGLWGVEGSYSSSPLPQFKQGTAVYTYSWGEYYKSRCEHLIFTRRIPFYWSPPGTDTKRETRELLRANREKIQEDFEYRSRTRNSYISSRFIKEELEGKEVVAPYMVFSGTEKEKDELLSILGEKVRYRGKIQDDPGVIKYRSEKKRKRKEAARKRPERASGVEPKHTMSYVPYKYLREFTRVSATRPASSNWEAVDWPEGKFRYVVLDRFLPYSAMDSSLPNRQAALVEDLVRFSDFGTLHKYLDFMECITGESQKVYGIKKKHITEESLPDNAESYALYLAKTIKKWLDTPESPRWTMSAGQYAFLNKLEVYPGTKEVSAVYPGDYDNFMAPWSDGVPRNGMEQMNWFIEAVKSTGVSPGHILGSNHAFTRSIQLYKKLVDVPGEVLNSRKRGKSMEHCVSLPMQLMGKTQMLPQHKWEKAYYKHVETLYNRYWGLGLMINSMVRPCSGNRSYENAIKYLLSYMKAEDKHNNRKGEL